jgi:hypothetical protein
MRLNPPRVGEILAGAFGALLVLSLFLPWYRSTEPATVGCGPEQATCPRETLTGFEALAVVDVVLLLIGLGGVVLLFLEMTQRSPAVPVAWSALLVPLAVVGFVLVVWRVLVPPGDAVEEPLFAFLGLVASGGLTAATLLSMRSESYGWRARGSGGASGGRGLPEPLSVPRVPGGGSEQGPR